MLTSYLSTVAGCILLSMLQPNQHRKVEISMQLTTNQIRHFNDPTGRAKIGNTIHLLSQSPVYHIPLYQQYAALNHRNANFYLSTVDGCILHLMLHHNQQRKVEWGFLCSRLLIQSDITMIRLEEPFVFSLNLQCIIFY